jgi:nicotinate-nucleotide adenylyltransferase
MIGILGGTFDPIHLGHLHVAEQVQSIIGLDEVHFLPCAVPVHRHLPQVSDANRVKMIELAIAGNDNFRLNTLELDRGGKSYMVDTLRQIRSQNQFHRIILILGIDAFNQFPGWKAPDEILQLAHLVVCRRPGIEMDRSIYANHWENSVQSLKNRTHACILPLEIEESPCSSTQVRQILSQPDKTAECLTPAVFKFIMSNHLYE